MKNYGAYGLGLITGIGIGLAGSTMFLGGAEKKPVVDSSLCAENLAELIQNTRDQSVLNIDEGLRNRIVDFRNGNRNVESIEIKDKKYALVKIPDGNAKGDFRVGVLSGTGDGNYIDSLRCGSYSLDMVYEADTHLGEPVSNTAEIGGITSFDKGHISREELGHLADKLDKIDIGSD